VTVRIYLPSTPVKLATWWASGVVPADAERYLAPDSTEEQEYAALMEAADASAALQAPPSRRVVVVAEVGTADGPVPFREVVAVHADPEQRSGRADPDDDLAWFAVQEIEDLLAGF
jgi:hypothetical protein